ncbi:hypothetical protein NDU88_002144 [Pleurodeles waltl]|uniref:Secreted protein n=1 Tax=Pleurodeles waltl TaxID=8319 RepID=A0AAV7VZT6_PLEWA|nr:hypothetical protein NDU88_002144 [Pleurodeles waltl]
MVSFCCVLIGLRCNVLLLVLPLEDIRDSCYCGLDVDQGGDPPGDGCIHSPVWPSLSDLRPLGPVARMCKPGSNQCVQQVGSILGYWLRLLSTLISGSSIHYSSTRGLASPSVRGPSVCPTLTESSVSPLRSRSDWRPTPIRVPQTGPPSIAPAQFVLPVTFEYLRAEAISRSEAAME